ncbi:MAG: recombinase family protein [Solobacterium sp.]|jgi:DNA invertase Pin-like site-specific DNA recombinase|nr:recombinase family protein [Solobacterium sp.]MCH4050185.1 recombinase family protein [Solobacterium sp.]MCH4073956.1 recombinase family protein [Solobacterium sp.]
MTTSQISLSSADADSHVILLPHIEKPKDHRIRAAVYCRVSSKHEDQEYSLENQIRHYRETIGEDRRYELVEIYYDFGISGFKEARPGFQRMLEESKDGKFELVITKSITRFARNTATVLDATRLLKSRGIGVFFELQQINTLGEGGELLMTLFAAFGQAESESNRLGTKMTIKRKVEKQEAIQQIQRVFGYTKNADGEIVPDENAGRVLEIFEMAADGFTVGQITNYLNSEGVTTKRGAKFYRTTVTRILTNEEYKGDFVQFKHYSDEHRKERKNAGEHAMIYYAENHPPIVTNELWEKAQQALGVRQNPKPEPEEKPLLDTLPYRHQLFCAKCGHRLMRSYTGGKNRWVCSGKERFSSDFCSGVSIPDEVVKSWGDFPEDRYISETTDRGRVTGFTYEDGDTWHKSHTRKRHVTQAPALTEENYPYKDRVYCKYCGGRLRRIIGNNGSVFWICNTMSRYGKDVCKGVRVPDEMLQSLRDYPGIVYIGKENIDGKERYGYSRQPDKKIS